jgi:effector-binding domain-containing protein
MIDKPQIVQTSAQPAAVIHITVPREEIQTVMGPAMAEVHSVAAAQGVAPAGPMFSHHLRMDPNVFDFEVGLPVSARVNSAGRVQPSELPAARVARTVYHGSYEGLADAWGEFMGWIEAEGLSPAPDLWECYLSGPESSPDPADWHTELNRPLVG